MITELTDKEILDFLMTSDFNDKLSPDESKFLLLKFRYFYRHISSRNDLLISDIDHKNKKIAEQELVFNSRIESLLKDNKTLSDKIDINMNRNLTLKERIFGKITHNKDESR